mgnify:CR=1 FL=1
MKVSYLLIAMVAILTTNHESIVIAKKEHKIVSKNEPLTGGATKAQVKKAHKDLKKNNHMSKEKVK